MTIVQKPYRQRRVKLRKLPFSSAKVPRSFLVFFGYLYLPLLCLGYLLWATAATAQAPAPGWEQRIAASEAYARQIKVAVDTVWVLFTAFLVIFMNAGFAMLETGFTRQKNAVNILSKNLIVFAISTIAFWMLGFALMFGDGNNVWGMNGFMLAGTDNSPMTNDAYVGVYGSLSWAGVPLAAKFLFQVAFAGTAATIVSGAVAERIRFVDFLIFSFILVAFIYPIAGHWAWGGGFLADLGFADFAGSTVVHSIGGWSALMGAALLGPRMGKFTEQGVSAIPGHNLAIATLGGLILWLGWFGFNPGSTMAADPSAISHIAVTTNLAASAAAIAATITAWLSFGKPDLSMIINGVLVGLVAITAGCAFVSEISAIIIGVIAGIIVVYSVAFFDYIKIDDPVGAISVHLIGGIWGTLAVGLLADGPGNGIYEAGPKAGLILSGNPEQFYIQFIGIAVVGGWIVVTTTIVWLVLKALFGLRVPPEEEIKGLDIGEHAMEAYPDFVKEQS